MCSRLTSAASCLPFSQQQLRDRGHHKGVVDNSFPDQVQKLLERDLMHDDTFMAVEIGFAHRVTLFCHKKVVIVVLDGGIGAHLSEAAPSGRSVAGLLFKFPPGRLQRRLPPVTHAPRDFQGGALSAETELFHEYHLLLRCQGNYIDPVRCVKHEKRALMIFRLQLQSSF